MSWFGGGRRKLEEELRKASSYTRSLIEASLDPLVTISPEGKITDVNEATIKVTGVSREKLIGTDFSNYFTEPEKASEGYRQVFEKGSVTDYPLTIRHRDGRLIDVLYNASVYRDVNGNVMGVFAAARDVTESKRVMREFAETKNFLDNIFESSVKYSIIGKDTNHRILSWNEGARRNYGYTAEEIIGKNSNLLHTPEDTKSGAVENLMQTAFEKGLAEGEFERIRKDGSRFKASVVVTRRNDASGNHIGYLLMSSDISDKKQAEGRLRNASQYARSLIEASVDPLVTISPEGKITDVNEATIKVTGVGREKLIGTDFSNYFTEPEKASEGYQQVFQQGSVTDYPLTIRHRNGSLTHVLYNASVYKDEQGNILGVFAAARDISEQRQASQYARSLIEASLDPLVTISPEGKITDVNEATIKVTGVKRDQLIGMDFSNYFTEPEKAREGYRQVFEKGFVTDYPLTIRHSSGKLTHVLYNASVYKDVEGNVQGVFAAARDITERKRMEEELRAASLYTRSLIEASLDPLVTISPEGKITDVNKATELVTGFSRDRLIGSDFSDYFTEPEKAREGYQRVISQGFVKDYPLTICHTSGRLTYVLYNAALYMSEAGKIQGVFAAARDITERRQAEENLRAVNREVQEAASVVASSASEILALTSELASVSTETAASVNETISTVEEVKQTAHLSSQKSRSVSDTAQQAVSVARQGNVAVTSTVEGINHIKALMESVAESIVRSSEQTQAIGEIITAVSDLAQQSNLLAVNAAIEASKAGEHGKGFAVVAQEIKSLADQSKQATQQVRAILGDIQQATSASVMAAEQVSKAVDAGVRQAAESGDSIRKLSESIAESADAATQIAASSQQQLIGVDQIATAMENIKVAAQQNVEGTKQAEQAAQNLNQLGMKLKEMVGRYQV
jgi:PAS domain S-box-containing protein